MIRILSACFLMMVASIGFGQKVNWKFTSLKKNDKLYQIVATATIPSGWHLYSSTTPEGGPVPTTFSFNKNPLIHFSGNVKEIGNLKTIHDNNFGVDVKYYADKVVFVQEILVKAKAKTNVNGKVAFMICNDHECLPPMTENISVKL